MKKHLHMHQPPSEVHSRAVLRCKVCAKRLSLSDEHLKVYQGGTYHLVCCPSCAAKFEAAPASYIVMS